MSSTAKLTAPRPFKGDLQAAQTWIYRIEAYIRANAALYADDDTKIYLVLGLLDGNKVVTKWAEAQYTFLANTQANHLAAIATAAAAVPPTPAPATPVALTWAGFRDAFRARWIPANNTLDAISKIAKLTQKGTVEDYIAEFLTLGYDTKLGDAPLLSFFKNGLNQMVLRTILNGDFSGTTIGEWMERAKAVDANFHSTGGKARGGFRRNEKKPTRGRADDEMEVDEVRVKGPKVGLTREKRERLSKSGKCWHCFGAWEPGHMCTKKNEAQKKYKKERNGGDSRDKTIRALQAQLAKLTNKDSSSENYDETAQSSESEAPLRKKVQSVRFTKKGKGKAAPGYGSEEDFGDDL
jgi:hypothetical protein